MAGQRLNRRNQRRCPHIRGVGVGCERYFHLRGATACQDAIDVVKVRLLRGISLNLNLSQLSSGLQSWSSIILGAMRMGSRGMLS